MTSPTCHLSRGEGGRAKEMGLNPDVRLGDVPLPTHPSIGTSLVATAFSRATVLPGVLYYICRYSESFNDKEPHE